LIHANSIWLEARPYAGGEPLTAQHWPADDALCWWPDHGNRRGQEKYSKAWSGRGRDLGCTVLSRKWRRLRALRFYKFLTT